MSLKSFFQNNVVNPTAINRGETLHKFAVITKVNESDNVCSIRYIDKDALERNKDNVPVKIYSPTMQDWFPEKDDVVTIEEKDGNPIITGVPEGNYAVNIKGKNELESDVLSDEMSCDTEGGYIY
ncbi:hypothetical protein [Heyndrickxia sporothermodurans]|jgi:hypothetical protein|uniref:hypothetical protein n=1 Tax=Heyndrickxia sporothermodurans TaxID=46224 RepID=UPI000D35B978|nr:hypothetical protein [Heyndrickxia sporothermodurans]PTY92876.1 hypothetical protein B5V90_02015 [Heyndrickxia sporothermodurans]